MDKVMNVSIFHPNWQLGGVERTNVQWCKHLKLHGHNVTLISNIKANRGLLSNNDFLQLGFTNYASWYHHFKKCHVLLICQSYYWYKVMPIVLLAKICGVKVILTERNSFQQYKQHLWKFYIYSFIFPVINKLLYSAIIVNSEEMIAEVPFKFVQSKTFCVKNPRFDHAKIMFLRKFENNVSSVPKTVRMYTRWHDQKNTKMIMLMSEHCRNLKIPFHVHCGESEYEFQRPTVDDVVSHMFSNPSVLFFCSHFEGYPNILLEARAVGLPIIYSECPTGVVEILDNYCNGYRFRANNSSDLLNVLENIDWEKLNSVPDIGLAEQHSVEASNLYSILTEIVDVKISRLTR